MHAGYDLPCRLTEERPALSNRPCHRRARPCDADRGTECPAPGISIQAPEEDDRLGILREAPHASTEVERSGLPLETIAECLALDLQLLRQRSRGPASGC